MNLQYPVDLSVDESGLIAVLFGGLPGKARGRDEADALTRAADALVVVLAGYADAGERIPLPPPARGRPLVPLLALESAKVALHSAMLGAGVSDADLAHRTGMPKSLVQRMRNPVYPGELANIRAPSYFAVTGTCRCWQCGQNTDVYALGVSPPFTIRDGGKGWREGTKLAILSYIENLPDSVIGQLPQVAPRFLRDSSKWHHRSYWMNHCSHCAAKIGDFETIESALGPFNAQKFDVQKVKFTVILEDFEAVACAHKQNGKPSLPP